MCYEITKQELKYVIRHPIKAASIYVQFKFFKTLLDTGKTLLLPWSKKNDDGASILAENDEVEYGLQPILDWAYYEGDEDLEIVSEEAENSAVSLAACVKIGKAIRDTLKGPIAIMCEEIQKVKGNSINDEYATIDEVNNVLKEYAQLTYLDENYITNARIEEEYLNSEDISNLYYDRIDIDEKEKSLNDKITANSSQLTTLTAKVNDCPTNDALGDLQKDVQIIASTVDTLGTTYATKEEFIAMGTNFDEKLNECLKTSGNNKITGNLEVSGSIVNHALNQNLVNLASAIGTLEQENAELKAKLAELESKLNAISVSNYYTKSECDNQYAAKPPTITVLEDRQYTQNSNFYYEIDGHFGEHFVMQGLISGKTFSINQVIAGECVLQVATNYYLPIKLSTDGQRLVLSTSGVSITYCAAYTDKEDEYVRKSIADATYQHI